MSLMQFLTVGRSFGGAKEGPNRYRVNEQCLLPKFGRPNPGFRTTTPSPASDVSTDRARVDVGETGSLFDLHLVHPPGDEPLRPPSSGRGGSSLVMTSTKTAGRKLFGGSFKLESSGKPAPSVTVVADRQPARTDVAQPELPVMPASNPFASPSAPAVVTEPSMVPPKKRKWQWLLDGVLYTRRKNVSARRTPVQGEWSLGAVTVVRNDLSDADLEVVPAASFSSGPVRRPAAEPVSRDKSLAGLSGRWIGWLLNTGRVRF